MCDGLKGHCTMRIHSKICYKQSDIRRKVAKWLSGDGMTRATSTDITTNASMQIT